MIFKNEREKCGRENCENVCEGKVMEKNMGENVSKNRERMKVSKGT